LDTAFELIQDIIVLLGFIGFFWVLWMFYDISKRVGYDKNGNQVVWKRKYWKEHKEELKALTERVIQEQISKERI
jgi:hypothetical protein